MNQLRREIASCIDGIEITDHGHLKATCRFPRDFVGFQGHFVGKPVLPGVCQIQTILVLFERHKNVSARLHEVVTAKFFVPAEGDDELVFDVRETSSGGGRYLVKTHVWRGEEKIARIDLLVCGHAAKG